MVGLRCFFLDPPKSFLSRMERTLRGEAHKMNFQKYLSRWTSPPMCLFFFFFLLTCLAFFFFVFSSLFTNVLGFFFVFFITSLSLILSGRVSFLQFFFLGAHMFIFLLILVGFCFCSYFFFRKQFWVTFLCYFFSLMKCLSIHNFLKV